MKEYSTDWKYAEIIRNLLRNSVEIFEEKILVWLFPYDLLECFNTTYILTYMFDGYPLKPYLELYNFNIEKYSIRNFEICEYYKDDLSDITGLINIVDGKINNVGKGYNTFTMYWFDNYVKNNTELILEIRKAINNFYKNKINIDTKENRKDTILWTTFKEYSDKISVKGIGDYNFLAHNIRATNDYISRYNLIYLANRNYNPIIKRWLIQKNLNTNDDSFALSEMIQWIFRSRIRENKPINIFIPSERMRNLLILWLENKF